MDDFEKYTDEQLIKIIIEENQEFYSFIIQRYQEKLFRYAKSLLRDEDKAVDIVQETFVKAFINLQSFNSNKKFSSWIYRIVHNEAINSFKKYKFEIPLLPEWDFKSGENLEKDFEKKETKEEVEKCLAIIPLKYSSILSLFYIEEKSYEEISDILSIPMGTVAARINRAKKLMKKICPEN